MLELSTPKQNHLLASLSKEVQDRLFPLLEPLPLPLGKSVFESGDTVRYVYFPTNSIVSLQHMTENGETVEISMVGNEGLIGIDLYMGGKSTPSRAVVQNSGTAYRLDAKKLKEEVSSHGELERLLMRYTLSLMAQMAQTAVCNRLHTIDQQLCRWFLLSLDRLSSNRVHLTHELIAGMIGVRRESISEAVSKLQKQGIIECHRGEIIVLDRPRLEELSCECYEVVKSETTRLLS